VIETKRITPEEVLAAYKATGLRPEQAEWAIEYEGGSRCACGLGAIFSSKVENGFQTLYGSLYSESDLIGDELGLSPSYIYGFTYGFDGQPSPPITQPNEREESERGYRDGRAAWEAVKHLAVSGV